MYLSSWESMTIKFVSKFYSFMWKYQVSWNFAENDLEIVPNLSEAPIYVFMIYFSLSVFLLSTCNTFGYPVLLPAYEFRRIDAFILFTVSFGMTCLYLICKENWKRLHEIVESFHTMCWIEKYLAHSKLFI